MFPSIWSGFHVIPWPPLGIAQAALFREKGCLDASQTGERRIYKDVSEKDGIDAYHFLINDHYFATITPQVYIWNNLCHALSRAESISTTTSKGYTVITAGGVSMPLVGQNPFLLWRGSNRRADFWDVSMPLVGQNPFLHHIDVFWYAFRFYVSMPLVGQNPFLQIIFAH